MKIAVVTSYFPIAGDAHRGHSAYQTLLSMRAKADIEVICPMARYPVWLAPRKFRYLRPDLQFQPAGLKTIYLEYPALPWLSRPVNGLVCARLLYPHLAAMRPDVILNYWLYPEGFSAVRVGRRLRIPVIAGAIGSDLRLREDAVTTWLVRRTLHGADAALTVSEELRRRALDLGLPAGKVTTVHNGCDFSIFHPADRAAARRNLGIADDAELIVYVGRISVPKGMAELTEAMLALAPLRPRLRAAVIGDGDYRATMEARALAGGLADRFVFPGSLNSRQIVEWHAASNLFCLPSYSEGCPNVVVEAIACGRPVVTTNVGGIPELVDESCGIMTNPRDSRALAAALEQTLTREWDPARVAAHLGRSWLTVAEETYQLCERVCREYHAS